MVVGVGVRVVGVVGVALASGSSSSRKEGEKGNIKVVCGVEKLDVQ